MYLAHYWYVLYKNLVHVWCAKSLPSLKICCFRFGFFCINLLLILSVTNNMHCSGILILTSHVSSFSHGEVVKNIVSGIKKLVSSTLYVHVANTSPCKHISEPHKTYEQLSQLLKIDSNHLSYHNHERRFARDVFPFLYKFYDETSRQCRELDVNILLHSIGYHHNSPFNLQK